MISSRFGFLGMAVLLALSACSDAKIENKYPDPDQERMYRYGSLSGSEGISLFEKGKKSDAEQSGIGVNSFLWRATLDTVSFMPLTSADPFGGVVVTDWYTSPNANGERTKAQIYILSRELKADALKASVFRQVSDGRGGWKDAPVAEGTARKLEDAILNRARQLRQDNQAQ